MNYEEYAAAARAAAGLLEKGDKDGALAAFQALAEAGLPDMDTAVMHLNQAVILAQSGDVEGALLRYDRAIAIESKHNRFAVTELKAVFLAQQGRHRDSLELFRVLAKRPDANFADRTRYEQNVRTLEAKAR
jgi:tetratricopeptide (TPR) repeat protein